MLLLSLVVLDVLLAIGLGVKLFVWPPEDEHELAMPWKQGVPPLLEGSQGTLDGARGNFTRLWNWRVTNEAGQDPVRVLSAISLFVILTIILPFLFLTGFSMKAEVATEIFTGSQGVQPWTLNLGFAVLPVTIVNVVAAGMVLAEMILGIGLHFSNEWLHQARDGRGQGQESTFKVFRAICVGGMVLVVGLEAMFGVFRGKIEAQGELIPTIGMVGISIVLSVITILTSYFWKSNLSSLMVPLRWILMVLGWVVNCLWVALAACWWFLFRGVIFQAYLVGLVLETISQGDEKVRNNAVLFSAAAVGGLLLVAVAWMVITNGPEPVLPEEAASQMTAPPDQPPAEEGGQPQ